MKRRRSTQQLVAKSISMLMAIVMLFYVLPLTVFAQATDDSGNSAAAGTEAFLGGEDENSVYTGEGGVEAIDATFEVEELREESVKHFRLSGQSFATQYEWGVKVLRMFGVII